MAGEATVVDAIRYLLRTGNGGGSAAKQWDAFRWTVLIAALVRRTPMRSLSVALVVGHLVVRLLSRFAPARLVRLKESIEARRYLHLNALAFNDHDAYARAWSERRSSRLSSFDSLPPIDELAELDEDGDNEDELYLEAADENQCR